MDIPYLFCHALPVNLKGMILLEILPRCKDIPYLNLNSVNYIQSFCILQDHNNHIHYHSYKVYIHLNLLEVMITWIQ